MDSSVSLSNRLSSVSGSFTHYDIKSVGPSTDRVSVSSNIMHVVGYAPEYGPSASYYAWEAAGRPVHGVRR